MKYLIGLLFILLLVSSCATLHQSSDVMGVYLPKYEPDTHIYLNGKCVDCRESGVHKEFYIELPVSNGQYVKPESVQQAVRYLRNGLPEAYIDVLQENYPEKSFIDIKFQNEDVFGDLQEFLMNSWGIEGHSELDVLVDMKSVCAKYYSTTELILHALTEVNTEGGTFSSLHCEKLKSEIQ